MIATIKSEIGEASVRVLGVSQSDLITALIASVVLLVLLFVFIFIGLAVFKPASMLSSIVDAALPALAGVGLGLRKRDEDKLLQSLGKSSSWFREDREETGQGSHSLNQLRVIHLL